jgi:Tfp pilus assembly protein FimT
MGRGRRYSVVEILIALSFVALLAYLVLPVVWRTMAEYIKLLR